MCDKILNFAFALNENLHRSNFSANESDFVGEVHHHSDQSKNHSGGVTLLPSDFLVEMTRFELAASTSRT